MKRLWMPVTAVILVGMGVVLRVLSDKVFDGVEFSGDTDPEILAALAARGTYCHAGSLVCFVLAAVLVAAWYWCHPCLPVLVQGKPVLTKAGTDREDNAP